MIDPKALNLLWTAKLHYHTNYEEHSNDCVLIMLCMRGFVKEMFLTKFKNDTDTVSLYSASGIWLLCSITLDVS